MAIILFNSYIPISFFTGYKYIMVFPSSIEVVTIIANSFKKEIVFLHDFCHYDMTRTEIKELKEKTITDIVDDKKLDSFKYKMNHTFKILPDGRFMSVIPIRQ